MDQPTGVQKGKKNIGAKKKVGKYIVDSANQLGKGSYGIVYTAENQETKQVVAVKIINKDETYYEDECSRNALVREIQIMKNLKSPYIIQFQQISETSNNIYIFQQMADKGSLQNLIPPQVGIPQKQAVQLMVQILQGFKELIKNGIIHRDIKPNNILTKNKSLKIADFGMSRYSGKFSTMETYAGTPIYMAPQILEQKRYTYRCDIWSLGVVFYQMITGNIPWDERRFNKKIKNEKDLLQLIKLTCKNGVSYPDKTNISKQMKDLIDGCLKYDEVQRYDWDQIYCHKLFQERFGKQSTNTEKFVITELRRKIHINNLSLEKLSSKIPQKLSRENFLNLLRVLDNDITNKEAQNMFERLSKGQNIVYKKCFLQCLEQNMINKNGIDTKALDEQSKNLKMLKQKISKNIYEKDIDLFDLYKKYDKKKNNRMGYQQFEQLILNISNELKKQEIKIIFKHFNAENTPTISFQNFYQNFCRAVKVPVLKDQQISLGIKKLVQVKKLE